MSQLIEIITSEDDEVRNRSLDTVCRDLSLTSLLRECESLDRFRRDCDNLYFRVRALFFLSAIHRYHVPERLTLSDGGAIPFAAYERLLQRRFHEAIDLLLDRQSTDGPGDALSSALSQAYRDVAFQTLADQVRRSVRSARGNQWMFRVGHGLDQPLRVRPELFQRENDASMYPLLRERTSVRMDLTHSAWSDIFFLGMDFPEAARVLNVSVDLGVHGRDKQPAPPIETFFRVIDDPVVRLTSVDPHQLQHFVHHVADADRPAFRLFLANEVADLPDDLPRILRLVGDFLHYIWTGFDPGLAGLEHAYAGAGIHRDGGERLI